MNPVGIKIIGPISDITGISQWTREISIKLYEMGI